MTVFEMTYCSSCKHYKENGYTGCSYDDDCCNWESECETCIHNDEIGYGKCEDNPCPNYSQKENEL